MKVFVTGVAGQLGHDIMNELAARGDTGIGSDLAEVYSGIADGSPVTVAPYVSLDITDRDAVLREIRQASPDVVVHCAAWTAVDAAEDEENRAKVMAINAGGTANIAAACKEIDCPMVYISTDYVFDGNGTDPWKPDCTDYKPLSIYGRSKLEGELAVKEALEKFFIVRIAWVFGKNGKNFIRTMLNVGKNHDLLKVVNDQIGTPTYTLDLAVLLCDMIKTDRYGYYHATNEGGYISWYDFAVEIFRQAALKWPEKGYDEVAVIPVSTEEYGLSEAERPRNSRLSKDKLEAAGFDRLPPWQNALERYLNELDS